jgi:hypothetical protein
MGKKTDGTKAKRTPKDALSLVERGENSLRRAAKSFEAAALAEFKEGKIDEAGRLMNVAKMIAEIRV